MPDSAPDPLDTTTAEASSPAHWSFATCLAFRFAFCYFMLYALCCGNATVWEVIPKFGEKIENWFAWPFNQAGQWLVDHVFHVQGVGAHLHDTGSGDTAIAWTAVGVMLATAIVATAVWAILDRKRTHYTRLFGWMRFTLRLTLGYAMLNYGFAKVFPLQMNPPSLAVLNEPFGNLSPMTLLWSTIGLNPLYEMICGAAEVLAGVLILFRRTALLGALFTAFVVSNVVLYNYFFDVPVKLYATHLLLMSLVLAAPDARSLFNYFIRHRPSTPSASWLPRNRRALWIESICITIVLIMSAGSACVDLNRAYRKRLAAIRHPSPYSGQWHLDDATLNGQPKPYTTGEGKPMTDVFLEPNGTSMVRASDALWRGGYKADDKKHTLSIFSVGHGGVEYAIVQPDPTHLILSPTGDDVKTEPVLHLTRVPLPSHYPLEERGFHLINEWGLER